MALISADMQSDLVINKMNANVFEQLKLEKKIVPDQLYLVGEDRINANDERIINCADPQEDNDVANKLYVDTMLNALKAMIAGSSSFEDLKNACK